MNELLLEAAVKTATQKPRRANGDLVQSLMRALTLLEILSSRPCRLTELAQQAGLPPSTTHRLLTTLEQKRFVRFDREESRWTVGSHCFAIGTGYLRRQDALADAAPRIESLANRIGATVNLGVRDGKNLMLVRQASGPGLSPAQPPGTNFPLHATAMGKVLLAGTQESPACVGLQRLTERTITDPAMLARELHQVRQAGFAIDNEESMTGRRCLAAPIHNEFGQCIAAISVTATQSQMTDGVLKRLGATLTATAAEIGRAGAARGALRPV